MADLLNIILSELVYVRYLSYIVT